MRNSIKNRCFRTLILKLVNPLESLEDKIAIHFVSLKKSEIAINHPFKSQNTEFRKKLNKIKTKQNKIKLNLGRKEFGEIIK